jgi:nitroreductase
MNQDINIFEAPATVSVTRMSQTIGFGARSRVAFPTSWTRVPAWNTRVSSAGFRDTLYTDNCIPLPGRYNLLSGKTIMSTPVDERLKFIFERRSIRVYTPGTVTEEQLQTMLAAAMAAPSAAAKYPWRFVVVRDRKTLTQFAAVLPNGQMLTDAALCIAVCGDGDVAHDRQLSYLLQDCSAAMENLLLAAHILGLGACWLGVHPREDRIRGIRKLLELPASVIPVACVSVGQPAESKEPHAEYHSEWVHFEKW